MEEASVARRPALGQFDETFAYEAYDEHQGWNEQSFGALTDEVEFYFSSEIRARGVPCQPGARWLEIGFGNGALLEFARRRKVDAFGVELQDSLLERARKAGFACARSLDDLAGRLAGPVDAIVAFDVFEHLTAPELITLLTQLRLHHCHPNTRLIARFPNGDSPFSLPMQHGDITHQLRLGSGAVHQLMMLSGWHCEYIGEPVWVSQSMTKLLAIRARNQVRRLFEWGVGSLYFGTQRPATLYQNYIMVARPGLVSAHDR